MGDDAKLNKELNAVLLKTAFDEEGNSLFTIQELELLIPFLIDRSRAKFKWAFDRLVKIANSDKTEDIHNSIVAAITRGDKEIINIFQEMIDDSAKNINEHLDKNPAQKLFSALDYHIERTKDAYLDDDDELSNGKDRLN